MAGTLATQRCGADSFLYQFGHCALQQAQAVRVFWAHDVPGHFKSANATLDRLQKYLDSRTAADMQYARSLSALPSIVLKPGGLDGVPGIGGRGASRSTYSPRHLVRKLREQQHRLQEHAQVGVNACGSACFALHTGDTSVSRS